MTVVSVAVPKAMVVMEVVSPGLRIVPVIGIGIVIVRAIRAISSPAATETAAAVISAAPGNLLDIAFSMVGMLAFNRLQGSGSRRRSGEQRQYYSRRNEQNCTVLVHGNSSGNERRVPA